MLRLAVDDWHSVVRHLLEPRAWCMSSQAADSAMICSRHALLAAAACHVHAVHALWAVHAVSAVSAAHAVYSRPAQQPFGEQSTSWSLSGHHVVMYAHLCSRSMQHAVLCSTLHMVLLMCPSSSENNIGPHLIAPSAY